MESYCRNKQSREVEIRRMKCQGISKMEMIRQEGGSQRERKGESAAKNSDQGEG